MAVASQTTHLRHLRDRLVRGAESFASPISARDGSSMTDHASARAMRMEKKNQKGNLARSMVSGYKDGLVVLQVPNKTVRCNTLATLTQTQIDSLDAARS